MIPTEASKERAEEAAAALAFLDRHRVDTLVIGVCDSHGIMRGKRVPRAQAESVFNHGVNLCDVLWVIDVAESDVVARPEGVSGYFPTETNGYPDIVAVPDPKTLRLMPWHPRTALVIADFNLPDGSPLPISPRAALARLVERARALDYEPLVAIEYEFYILRETADTLTGKRADDLVPLNPRPSTYGVVSGSRNEDLVRDIRAAMDTFGVPLEACNPETGPGQFEINIRYSDALSAADHAFLFKNAIKEIATQRDLTATFMAKPHTDWAGNSCHVHLSLNGPQGNCFYDADRANGISATMESAAAGMLKSMEEMTIFFAPTINAFRRFVPYSWAGTTATWGVDNRSTGVRAVIEGDGGTRLEQRQGGGDANPYLATAATLAGALYGIEQSLTPPALRGDDVYATEAGPEIRIPMSLPEAVDALADGEIADEYMGRDLVEHFLAMKRDEVESAATAVTDWEIARYLEAL